MTDPSGQPLDRRFLLRGGAVLAGAAGATALGAALIPKTAEAAVEYVRLNDVSTATAQSTITLGATDGPTAGSALPSLRLNNAGGPQLSLQALRANWDGGLALGDIANTTQGPKIGVDYGNGLEVDYLVTGQMLESIPYVVPLPYMRLIDTRKASQRDRIIATSPGALDAKSRLTKGGWMDIALFPFGMDYTVFSVFINLTVAKPEKLGYLTAYAPDQAAPDASTVNFSPGNNLSNAAFVAVSVVQEAFAIRIAASQTTHVVIDLSGVEINSVGQAGANAKRVPAVLQARRANQAKLLKKLQKSLASH
jgi:hypothetical protein